MHAGGQKSPACPMEFTDDSPYKERMFPGQAFARRPKPPA